MARARNIKPSIMDNDQLAELPPLTRLLFIYLWMLADRAGRLEDRPKRIAAQALPFDRDADADSMLADLEAAGFILRYKAGGCAYIQVANFAKHQAPHVREAQSTIPAPDGSVPSTGDEKDSNEAKHNQGSAEASTRHDQGSAETSPRSPDSLIPDSLIQKDTIPNPSSRKGIDELLDSIRGLKAPNDAGLTQAMVKEHLEARGFDVTPEAPVADRGDGRPGRIDLLAKSAETTIAIEIDRLSPRTKSLVKLKRVEADHRLVLLRGGEEAVIDGVVIVSMQDDGTSSAVTFKTFLERCKTSGEPAIAGYEPMVRYVEEAKLPTEFAQLCWDEFKRRHLPGGGRETKRQADWRRTFLNALQGGWFKLWWSPEPGRYELTSAGLQAKTVLDARRSANERAAA